VLLFPSQKKMLFPSTKSYVDFCLPN